MTAWDHRDKVVYVLSKGRLSRTDLLHKTRLKAAELDIALGDLIKDGLVRTERDTGRKGTPKTWVELVR